MPTQNEIDGYLADVRETRETAREMFDSDSVKVTARSNGSVLLELKFVPGDPTEGDEPTQGEMHQGEKSACDAADDLRGWGATVNMNSNNGFVTVYATFSD